VTNGYVYEEGKKHRWSVPFTQMLWFPNCAITQNKIYYAINVFLFQWVPAYLVDFLMWIFRQPRL
jgi:fatty acyl-CoA reductase